jgi:hypothetical protein
MKPAEIGILAAWLAPAGPLSGRELAGGRQLPAGQDDKGNRPRGRRYQRGKARGLRPSGPGRMVNSRDEPPGRAA